jgi:hypothetical protein
MLAVGQLAVAVGMTEGSAVGSVVGSLAGADADGLGAESFSVKRDCPPHATANARHEPASAGERKERKAAILCSVRPPRS